jgi:hypothetical protein
MTGKKNVEENVCKPISFSSLILIKHFPRKLAIAMQNNCISSELILWYLAQYFLHQGRLFYIFVVPQYVFCAYCISKKCTQSCLMLEFKILYPGVKIHAQYVQNFIPGHVIEITDLVCFLGFDKVSRLLRANFDTFGIWIRCEHCSNGKILTFVTKNLPII